MVAFDISKIFILYAKKTEQEKPLGISYQISDAVNLPFPNNSFDFIIATMSLMDIADNEKAIKEAYRVLKPGGFFQFSMTHPCFTSLGCEWVIDENGKKDGYIIRNYFKKVDGEIEEWIFGAAPKELKENMDKFKIPRFRKILSEWLNLLIGYGFVLEKFSEPHIDKEKLKEYPKEYDSLIIPFFLIIRCRK